MVEEGKDIWPPEMCVVKLRVQRDFTDDFTLCRELLASTGRFQPQLPMKSILRGIRSTRFPRVCATHVARCERTPV